MQRQTPADRRPAATDRLSVPLASGRRPTRRPGGAAQLNPRLDGALSAAAMQTPADNDSSAAEARARAVVGEPEWDLPESAVTSNRISRMLYRVVLLAANTVAERRADR